ncbi:MAG: hypothetical protein KDK12_18935 [Rhodobacteraceae bacterium]|nr:hypothetical protein [Paracoccaceae bacterium]
MTRAFLLAAALFAAAGTAAAREKPLDTAKLLPFMEQTNLIHAPHPQAPHPATRPTLRRR